MYSFVFSQENNTVTIDLSINFYYIKIKTLPYEISIYAKSTCYKICKKAFIYKEE